MPATVLWPTLLGLSFLGIGLFSYRRDLRTDSAHGIFALAALGPAFVAAALAAFAGEHFTAAPILAGLVPKWMPGRLFIAWFVGCAHLAAALSFVARRFMRWSTHALAAMFVLFVLLMDVPGAFARPSALAWMLAARQATFAMGALAMFAAYGDSNSSTKSRTIAEVARIWTGIVLLVYGAQHLVHPEYAPGVPSPVRTATWVPLPAYLARATGIILVACGMMLLVRRKPGLAAQIGGMLMLALTIGLYGPQFFLARNPQEQITAVNFIFDTMLFAGVLLVIGRLISRCDSPAAPQDRTPVVALAAR